jgi:uridine kinase
MSRAFGIAIAGPPGSGKSALAEALARRLRGTAVLAYDDHETVTSAGPAEVGRWLDEGGDPDRLDLASFVEAAGRLSQSAAYLVIDTPFARMHGATAPLIDLQVWLDTPADVALARKIRQMAGWAAADPARDAQRRFSGWLEAYLASYESLVARACVLQREKVRPLSDLVLVSDRDAGGLAERVIAALPAAAGAGREPVG